LARRLETLDGYSRGIRRHRSGRLRCFRAFLLGTCGACDLRDTPVLASFAVTAAVRKSTCMERPSGRVVNDLRTVLRWYFREVYRRHEGPGVLPFYCDPTRIGHFALTPDELRSRNECALFRLFVSLAMYQARRDVVIMRQQHALSRRKAVSLVSLHALARRVRSNPCRHLSPAISFERGCSVHKSGGIFDCTERPGATCHVKEAASAFNRMADLGKLPTSAWFRVWRHGGLTRLFDEVGQSVLDPRSRAEELVARLSRVQRVGRKLATMFVSALSVPALAPGLTPWFPEVDGNDLLVIDTNVARGIDALCPRKAPSTYESRTHWLREIAKRIDLRAFDLDVPRCSPRLVQQALYAFCSRSNRVARQDRCLRRDLPCRGCVPALCPLLPVGFRLAVAPNNVGPHAET